MKHLRTKAIPRPAASVFEPLEGFIGIVAAIFGLPGILFGSVNDGVGIFTNLISGFDTLVGALNELFCGDFFTVVTGNDCSGNQ